MRRTIEPTVLVEAGSLASAFNSPSMDVIHLDNIGLHLIWTGTPTGEFFIQASIDSENWDDLDITPGIDASGAPGSMLVSLAQLPYAKIRVRYARTSGTGSLKVNAIAKQAGG